MQCYFRRLLRCHLELATYRSASLVTVCGDVCQTPESLFVSSPELAHLRTIYFALYKCTYYYYYYSVQAPFDCKDPQYVVDEQSPSLFPVVIVGQERRRRKHIHTTVNANGYHGRCSNLTQGSQHSQECKDPRRHCFLYLVTLTFDLLTIK